MKTLPIRIGARHRIVAIATEAEDGGHDPCKTLAFFQEQARAWQEEMEKLGAILTDTCENGPPHDQTKFKKLHGSNGLYEFKSSQGLRLICFWDDGGLIVCTHGYVKDAQKAPKSEIELGQRMLRDYFVATQHNTLTHVGPGKKAISGI
jgi:phage-related protein